MTAQSERARLARATAPVETTTGGLTDPSAPLVSPFAGGGLIDVFRRRYLLKLLVQKEIQRPLPGLAARRCCGPTCSRWCGSACTSS